MSKILSWSFIQEPAAGTPNHTCYCVLSVTEGRGEARAELPVT